MARPVPYGLTSGNRPVRRAVRRLRWFKQTFAHQVDDVSRNSGIHFHLYQDRLAQCFVTWLRAFEAQKPRRLEDRRAYTCFASGLMLRHLLEHAPLEAVRLPAGARLAEPMFFWPEGYVYVAYCFHVRAAILFQEFGEPFVVPPAMTDVGTWQSFKENVHEDRALAIAFLDLFSGDQPDWQAPALFTAKPGIVRSLPFRAPNRLPANNNALGR